MVPPVTHFIPGDLYRLKSCKFITYYETPDILCASFSTVKQTSSDRLVFMYIKKLDEFNVHEFLLGDKIVYITYTGSNRLERVG